MSSPPWFRLYSEILSDRKLKRVEVITGQSKALILGCWTIILCMASDSPERGKLLISDDMPITEAEIIAETGLDYDTGKRILDAFTQAGLIEQSDDLLTACNWDKRQFTSDTSNERVAKYRAKKQQEATETEPEQPPDDTETLPNPPVTNGNVTVTPPDTDTDTDTEIPKGNGKPLAEIEKPKTMLMGTFQTETGLKLPHKKSDIGFWWSNIGEIYHIVDEDVGIGQSLIQSVVRKMKDDNLTIVGPQSIVNMCRSMAANGAGKPMRLSAK